MLYPFTNNNAFTGFETCSDPQARLYKAASRTPLDNATKAKKKKLTVMIYMAGDNNLEPYINVNKRWIEHEGVDADMNMLLFMCTHRTNEPKLATKAIVEDHKTTIIEKIKGLDSGNKETLIKACQWATQYPSDEYAFILWDHGSGPLNKNARRGICYDNTTGHFLTDADLHDAFTTISQQYLHGKKLAFIGFDACLMGAIEIASVIKPFTNYMISSEHTIPAVGWPYHIILKSFKEHKNNLTTFITHDIVNAYQNYYDHISQDYTLSCIDTNKIDPIIENINNISQTLSDLLNVQKNHSVSDALSDVSTDTTRFDEPAYADLYDWYTHILKKVNSFVCIKKEDTTRLTLRLQLLAKQGIDLVAKAVVAAVQGTYFSQTHGMLIYLPERYIDKTYLTTQWASQTKWLGFLRTYLDKNKAD
jgi:hypothetical protein